MVNSAEVKGNFKHTISYRSGVSVFLIGALVGLLGWLLTLAVSSWVLTPVFCRSLDTASVCAGVNVSSWIVAHIMVSAVGLLLLLRANTFRPLLVVIAALATLWTVGVPFITHVWWVGLLWQTGLFAVAYALYAWLAALEKFIVSAILIIIIVILMRLIFIV